MSKMKTIKLIISKQRSEFLPCYSPVTIDKRKDWGDNSDNVQKADNGAFLKISNNEVTHLVQPKEDFSAPIGWVKVEYSEHSKILYSKLPIWVDMKPLREGEICTLQTKDGQIQYEIKEESYICYNDNNGLDPSDPWIQTRKELEKNYYFEV